VGVCQHFNPAAYGTPRDPPALLHPYHIIVLSNGEGWAPLKTTFLTSPPILNDSVFGVTSKDWRDIALSRSMGAALRRLTPAEESRATGASVGDD
jgi:hypothetical protein